jgi:hypothetical protein
MITVYILITTQSLSTTVVNLIGNLNLVQQEFNLEVEEKPILLPPQKQKPQWIATELLLKAARKRLGEKYSSDNVLVICDQQIEEDDYIWSYENGNGLISTYGMTKEFLTVSLEKYLAYLIAGFLLNIHVDTPIHADSKGCLGDYCEDKKDINFCLARCDVCFECRSLILQAVGRGEITLSKLASIYRILDYAGGRKICFVLMPFHKKFQVIYTKCIKLALIDQNWTCIRADEIYESREIPHLIYEQILRADLIIAELTDTNPNVLYELGYAHALAKNTMLITQSEESVPFDLRHRQIIYYSQTSKGLYRLVESIRSRLKEI